MASPSLKGRSWQEWPLEPDDDWEPVPAAQVTNLTSPMCSPTVPVIAESAPPPNKFADDVMKLPRREMHLFGQCPVRDDFILVVCDLCSKNIKLESFGEHYRYYYYYYCRLRL